MDNIDPDLVNLLDTQADQTDVINVHLRSTQEDTRMLEPDVVDRIRELSGQGLGSKRIARQLGISRNSVRRYLAGAMVGFQERLAARRLDGPTLRGWGRCQTLFLVLTCCLRNQKQSLPPDEVTTGRHRPASWDQAHEGNR